MIENKLIGNLENKPVYMDINGQLTYSKFDLLEYWRQYRLKEGHKIRIINYDNTVAEDHLYQVNPNVYKIFMSNSYNRYSDLEFCQEYPFIKKSRNFGSPFMATELCLVTDDNKILKLLSLPENKPK